MEPGAVDENGDLVSGGPSYSSTDPEMESKDGYSYKTLEPSGTSEDKTQWGIEIEIDKEKGQRTYTDFGFTNTGNYGRPSILENGNVSANEVGEKLSEKGDFQDPNYKPDAEIVIDGKGLIKNLNLYATEEDLKHINDKDNKKIIMAWEGKYTQDNPNGPKATQGTSAAFNFTVNPWPNENDKLQIIKLNGKHDDKEFVQGQTITTNVKVDNLDKSARERLVGQVYHPLTGEVVPGAKAYINDEGKVVVEMPRGTINADGSINENSIFYTDAKYKGLQNLEVKFFARPRTADEFKAIAEEYFGTYTETGAGKEIIDHKGKQVVIDKQGIDRYDHYNLIGGFKLNLDDTRYYDQDFRDKNQDDTSKHTHSKVKPGEEFDVNLYVPTDKKDKDAFPNQKTPEEMEAAKNDKQAIGSIDMSFIDQINKDKEEKDKWVLDYDESTLPTTFKITPPKSAKAGDFVAVPLTYTYTNGSTDVHWFHFVVQESDYIKPDYETQVNFPAKEQTSSATVNDDGKRITPDHYTLPDDLETDDAGNKFVTDDSGNKWTVTLDEETGKVSAKPVYPLDFNGGEKLTVPVISHYKDDQKPGQDITEESEAYFVIEEKANKTARYNAQAGKAGDELSSDAILNTEDTYNRSPGKYTLDSDAFVDDKGNTWKVTIDEKTGKVTATVPEGVSNDKLDGALLNVSVTTHYYEENGTLEVGTKKTEVQFVATGTELNSPQYNVSIGDGNSEMTNSVIINADDKKDSPTSYTIDETKTYTDDQGNEWTVSVDGKTGEVKATPTDPSKLKGGEKLQVPVTAHYGEGEEAPTQKATAEFVVKDKEYASPDYAAKVVKVGETESADVKLTDGDNLKKPTKYTLDSTEFTDDKGNTWTVSIDETTGKVTATAPSATAGELLKLDGALLNVPVTAHYEDATGKDVTRKTSVQFVGSGTQGTHTITEEIPFETKVEVVNDLAPGKWRYKVVDGKEQKGVNGSVTKEITIKDSKVEGEPKTIKTVEPVDAIIEIGNADYTGTVTHTEKIETPFEVEYQYSDELEAGQSQIKQKGEKGSYDLVYSQKIKNGEADGEATTDKKNVTEAKKEIIVIGIKPVENVVEKPFKTIYEYDENMEAGKTEEVTPGVNGKTTTNTSYDQKENKLVSKEETVEPTNRVVKVGTKPVEKTESIPHDTTYKHNPELAAGTIVKKSDGTPGTVTITTSFNKETGKLETQVTRTEPTNAVYEYGSKTEGKVTVTSDIPYEVEFVPDDTMVSGETKVEQEGELGKKETTIIIENSVESSRTEKVTKEPVKKIVKYGTPCKVPGTDDPSKPGTEDPGKPGTEDPGKPGTEDPGKPGTEDPGKPGTEDPGHPGTEDPGKPGTEDPSNPGTEDPSNPGTEDPGHPGTEDPGKPGTEDPSHPGTEKPDKEGLLKPSDEKPSKPGNNDTEVSADKAFENIEGESAGTTNMSNEDYRKAPQTSDPGVGGYLKLGGLATALFAFLQRKKKEADEE